MRYLRAITAAFTLLILVAGIPVLLLLTVGNPLSGWPAVVAGDLSDAVLVDVLAAVTYLAWAQFALAVLTETISLLGGLRPPARLLIVPASQRRLARTLIAAAFLLSPAATSSAFTATAPLPAPLVATAPLTVTAMTTPTADGVAATAHQAQQHAQADQPPTYTIRTDGPGTYWDLAEHFLGDGQRWPEIWHLNDGRRQADGTAMTSPGLLRPGWTVRLPASTTNLVTDLAPASATGAGAPAETSAGEVTVKGGDSLWSIAEAHLGGGRAWPTLYQLNRGRPQPDGGRLTDPDLIQPGWILNLPHDHPAAGAPAGPPPPSSRPSTTEPPMASPAPALPTATEPGTPQPSTAEPSATDPASASANGATRAEATASPAASPAHQAGSTTGVDLPGGWVTIPFAAAVSAAGALVWLRRRRRHRYAPLEEFDLTGDGLDPDDSDLQPLPAIVHRMRRAVREQAPRLLDPPPAQPTITEYVADPTRYRPPPVGPSGPDLTGLTDLAHPDGLGLTGPGADSAARALLVAVLSAGGPQDPDAGGQLIIPTPTLEALLGDQATEAQEIPRLRVTADVAEAVDLLEQEHLQRLRTLDEFDVEDIAQLRSTDPAYPPMPPVVLLTHTPPEHLRAKMIGLIHLGAAVDIHAVLLGEWPPGITVELAVEGTTTLGARAHRVATLDRPAAVELLQVLSEAHTGEPVRQPPTGTTGTTESDDAEGTAAAPNGAQLNSTSTAEGAADDVSDAADLRPTRGKPPESEGAAVDVVAATDADPPYTDRSQHPQVAIRVLGRVAVLDEQGKTVSGLRQHAGGLLAYLVIHRAGADKDDIMEALWPEASLRRAAERLSTEVGNLRRCIRQAAMDQDAQPVINTGGRYHLNPSLVDVDVWNFQDALHQATSVTDPALRQAALRAAVFAHTGPVADGRDYHWLEPAREQVRRNGIRARLHLADLISAEDPHQAADLTKAAAGLDPTNEELARLAMGAHARAGDALAVAARLRHLRSALREIDEDPSPETLTLAAQLQERDRKSTSSAAPVTVNGHGAHPNRPVT
jgi:DNA-binding SARP family transcriptional activator/nucleoid-associated protein YgaU